MFSHNVAIPAVFNSIKKEKDKKNRGGKESNSPVGITLLNYNGANADYLSLKKVSDARFK